jgi:hypothetical protein
MPAVNSAALGPFFAAAGTLMRGLGAGVGGGGVPESLWQALAAARAQSVRTLAVFIQL